MSTNLLLALVSPMHARAYCTHKHAALSRPYPRWGLACPPTTSTCSSIESPKLHPTMLEPAKGKRKSMLSLSIEWPGRQQRVNHSLQAMADWLGHRSERNLCKTHYSMACHRIRWKGGGVSVRGVGRNERCSHRLIRLRSGGVGYNPMFARLHF